MDFTHHFFAVLFRRFHSFPQTSMTQGIHGGKAKVLGLYAKRARGAMARFVVTDQVANANGLKDFNWQGYRFDETLSSVKELVFTRPKP